MRRRAFIGGAVGLFAGLYVGRLPNELLAPEPSVALEFWPHGSSLTASGGLCAPVSPIYEIATFPIGTRPVREALPEFRIISGNAV